MQATLVFGSHRKPNPGVHPRSRVCALLALWGTEVPAVSESPCLCCGLALPRTEREAEFPHPPGLVQPLLVMHRGVPLWLFCQGCQPQWDADFRPPEGLPTPWPTRSPSVTPRGWPWVAARWKCCSTRTQRHLVHSW